VENGQARCCCQAAGEVWLDCRIDGGKCVRSSWTIGSVEGLVEIGSEEARGSSLTVQSTKSTSAYHSHERPPSPHEFFSDRLCMCIGGIIVQNAIFHVVGRLHLLWFVGKS
jgi:hypothetical protein